MSCLFPAANHNRFSHSIGVYHLGMIAFDNFVKNINSLIPERECIEILKLRDTFGISCLMHDCGHAPFSHTFENLYLEGDKKKGKIDSIIVDMFNADNRFKDDFEDCECAAHEKISAIVLNRFYKEHLDNFKIDPILSARMIMGCKYHDTEDHLNKLKNCLISLLNSKAIDVDKLDYIMRDTWASGVSNSNIDVKRLLSSLTISIDEKSKYGLAFKKNSLSVIKSVVDGRNFLYKWIYSHPKIIYQTDLIKKAVHELGKTFCYEIDSFNSKFFSIESFGDFIYFNNDKLYLINDDDIMSLLKREIDNSDVPSARRLFYRDHHRALWKTHGEFSLLFSDIGIEGVKIVVKYAKKKLFEDIAQICGTTLERDDILILETEPKEHIIKKSDILIKIDEKCYSYTDIFGIDMKSPEETMRFFYIYYDKKISIDFFQKKKIINILRAYN